MLLSLKGFIVSNLKYIEKYIECLQIFVTELEIGKMLLLIFSDESLL